MAERELNIILKAKNRLAGGLSKAKQQLQKFRKDTSAPAAGGQVEKLAGVVMNLGKIQGALAAVSVATKVWQGDFKGAEEALLRLPFGLGEIMRWTRDIAHEWSGIADEMREAEKTFKLIAEDTERIAKRQAAFKSGIQITRSLKDQLSLLRAVSAEERSRISVQQQFIRTQRQIETQRSTFKKAGIDRGDEFSDNALILARKVRDEQLFNLDKKSEADRLAARQKSRAAAKTEADKKLKAIKAHQDAQGDLLKRGAESQRRLTSAMRIASLRDSGQGLAAEMEQIREHYRQRLAAATTAQEIEENVWLRGRAMSDARQRTAGRGRLSGGAQSVSVGSRFSGLAQTFNPQVQAAQETARNTKQSADLAKSMARDVKAALQALRAMASDRSPELAGHIVRN